MKIPDGKISFGIPMNVMVEEKDRKVHWVMDYYSDTGFDAHFFDSLGWIRDSYATSFKKLRTINIPNSNSNQLFSLIMKYC